jgi:hypothetical protein
MHDVKHDTTTANTEQHHLQAAEHLELAAKSHAQAVVLLNDAANLQGLAAFF